jgi:hypothetical protein
LTSIGTAGESSIIRVSRRAVEREAFACRACCRAADSFARELARGYVLISRSDLSIA